MLQDDDFLAGAPFDISISVQSNIPNRLMRSIDLCRRSPLSAYSRISYKVGHWRKAGLKLARIKKEFQSWAGIRDVMPADGSNFEYDCQPSYPDDAYALP